MTQKPQSPVCKSFLVCRRIGDDPKTHEPSLLGLFTTYQNHNFPAAVPAGIFARLASAHGEYQIEVQLHSSDGEVVWKEGPPAPLPMSDPLMTYDLRLSVCLVFPKPDSYDLVLFANDEELARERFIARIAPQMAQK